MMRNMGLYFQTYLVGEYIDKSQNGGGEDAGCQLLKDGVLRFHANLRFCFSVFDYMLFLFPTLHRYKHPTLSTHQ